MKKALTTITLAIVLMFGATFANADTGIIVVGKAASTTTDTGIIVVGKDGIIVVGKAIFSILGIIVVG